MIVLWLTDLVFILASRHLFSHVGEVICPSGLLCSNFVMGDFQFSVRRMMMELPSGQGFDVFGTLETAHCLHVRVGKTCSLG
jgi:hypothetical protein